MMLICCRRCWSGVELDEGGDPPRIWSPFGEYPGTAFTRSMGDVIAEELGVTADPEIIRRRIHPHDKSEEFPRSCFNYYSIINCECHKSVNDRYVQIWRLRLWFLAWEMSTLKHLEM